MGKRTLWSGSAVGLAVVWLIFMALVMTPSARAVEEGPASQMAPTAERHVCPSGCAYSSVQAAINAAAPNDVIKVASGVYTDVHEFYVWSNPSYSARQVAYITKSLTIAGGYTVTDWTTADPVANPTVLDAGGQGRVIHAYDDSNAPIAVTLRGLQITGGEATAGGDYNNQQGGGIWARSTHLIVEDCQIEGNAASATIASAGGGGIYAFQATVAMTDTVLTHNQAAIDGGGLYLFDSPLTLIGSVVISNSAQNHAGGIYAYNGPSTVYVENTRFHDNWAKFDGGGLSLNGPDGVLINAEFTANRAGAGAGLASKLGVLEIADSTFSGNEATGEGGALAVIGANALTVTRSLLQDNSAGGKGGAMMVRNSDAFLENVAVVDNAAATEGSGLWLEAVDATLHHVTLARNTGGDGTGLHITHPWDNSRFSNVDVVNTIIAGHDLGVFLGIGDAASLNTVLWDGNTINSNRTVAGSNNRSGNANFGPDGYHIMPGSDAFEQGNPNYTPQATEDIDGDPRPMKSGYDIGADELAFQTEMYRNPWSGDVYLGDEVEFWFKIINWSPSTYTVAYTYTVPACLIPQGAITGTGTVPSGITNWFSPRTVFEIAPGSDGPCTNTATFVTAEGLQGSASLMVNVVGGVSAVISETTGGDLVYEEAGSPVTEIAVPGSAVTEATTLVYTPVTTVTGAPGGFSFAGIAFELSAYRDNQLLPDFDFETGITITLHYTDDQIAGLDEATLALTYWDGALWTTDGITQVGQNLEANTVSFWVTHLTAFTLFAEPTYTYVYLPLIVRQTP